MLADVESGRAIIERLAQRSAALGTTVTFDEGIGKILLPAIDRDPNN